MDVEKEIETLKEGLKEVKRLTYDNKDSITTLTIETRMFETTLNKFEISISKLVDKLDAYITKQNDEDKQEVKEKLTNYEKVLWFLKTSVLTLVSSFILLLIKEYFF